MHKAQQASKHSRTKIERRPNERLKAQRLKKNWTQVYVATMIGTSDVEVSRWETGATEPGLYFREKLCALFGATPEGLGFVTAAEAGQEVSESTSSLLNFPYRRNPFFTGREEVLARLHTLLHAGKATALVQAQAISGLGGIGKTQTAIEYAYRYHADYSTVLWVKADTRASLFSEIAALAQTLNLAEKDTPYQEQCVAAVLRWLREHTNWLLVLDNVEDFVLIEQVLSLKTGHVLWPGNVLILQSDDDPATKPAMRLALRNLYPQAQVYTFHQAGHTPFLSQPDAFYPRVRAFLHQP